MITASSLVRPHGRGRTSITLTRLRGLWSKGSVTSARFTAKVRAAVGKLRLWHPAWVLGLVALLGLAVVGDHGISEDEVVGIDMVHWNADGEMADIYRYDGTVFNELSEWVFQVSWMLSPGPTGPDGAPDSRTAFLRRIAIKHRLTFLVSLLAYACAAGLVGLMFGPRSGWLAVVALLCLPRFWGHAFFNFKDIPFAAGFTAASLLSARWIAGLLALDQRLGWRHRLHLQSVVLGLVIGLLCGVRLAGGVVLIFLPLVFWIARGFGPGHRGQDALNLVISLGLVGATCAVTTYAAYPTAWSNPVGWLLAMARTTSAYPWPDTVLFAGQQVPASNLPWTYLPVWLGLTTPLVVGLAAAVGFFSVLRRFTRMDPDQRAAAALVLLQALALPTMAVALGATLYDGLRHMLFMLPALACLAAAGAMVWLDAVRRRWLRWGLGGVLVAGCLLTWFDAARLHPYTYVYFNRVSGGLAAAAGRYELDYWGLSLREGMQRVNATAAPGARVVVAGPLHSASAFAREDLELIHAETPEAGKVQRPFYYLVRVRWEQERRHPDCPIIERIEREGAALGLVKFCAAAPSAKVAP